MFGEESSYHNFSKRNKKKNKSLRNKGYPYKKTRKEDLPNDVKVFYS